MHRLTTTCLALLLAACGGSDQPAADGVGTSPGAGAAAAATGTTTSPAAKAATPAATRAAKQPLNGRTGELVNPDDTTMVFLYFDVAGVTPPLDNWVEQDSRVMYAQGAAKATMRTTMHQELQAGAAAVQDVGRIRLSLHDANLSNYDPGYGEFTVRALSPSSVIKFTAFRQNVELKFGNGRTAQIWRVPEAEAQAITDRVGGYRNVELDALLQISAVQPGMNGGTLVVDILEYEMRESQGGTTLGRVQVAP